MKSVFRLSVFSLFCAGISLVVLAVKVTERRFSKKLLCGGYLLPSEVNQPFDPKKSALGKVFFESTDSFAQIQAVQHVIWMNFQVPMAYQSL